MKRNVNVTQVIEVEVDESKFTPEFMAEFRRHFYRFVSIEQHLEHLGQLYARGMAPEDFIEGYGNPDDFGIKFEPVDTDVSVERGG